MILEIISLTASFISLLLVGAKILQEKTIKCNVRNDTELLAEELTKQLKIITRLEELEKWKHENHFS